MQDNMTCAHANDEEEGHDNNKNDGSDTSLLPKDSQLPLQMTNPW